MGTAFQKSDGDHIEFYIISLDSSGLYLVQDDVGTAPYLEACGADLDVGSRADVFNEILAGYRITYNDATFEITSEPRFRSRRYPKLA